MELSLAIAVFIGLMPAAIAQSKGKSFVAWWLYGAALFIVALPHSLLMKADMKQIRRLPTATNLPKYLTIIDEEEYNQRMEQWREKYQIPAKSRVQASDATDGWLPARLKSDEDT